MLDAEREYIDRIVDNRNIQYHQDLLIYLVTKNFETAKHVLAKAKQGLVIEVIVVFIGQGISFLDLINEGNIGLFNGIESLKEEHVSNNIDEVLIAAIKKSVEEAIAYQERNK